MIVDSVFNKWNINKLPRQKGAQGNYSGSTVINRNENNVQNTGIQGHYLWGNYFDATQDINGDINTQGDVNFYGNLNYQGEYNPDDELHGNLNIGRINAEDGNIKNINSDLIKAAEAYIENLTVTGSAHFFELIIDKIRSVGGAIMLTPGDGFELYGYNIKTSNQINLWWVKTDDRNGKYNQWEIGDQALCRNFDAAVVGKSSNIRNKYWWAKVVDVDTTGQWVVKLYNNQYNRDEVMALPIGNNNAYYENTHGYLKKSDFQPTTDYVYVETAQKNHWITNEEYYRLDDNEKAEYEFSQLYVHENGDGSVIKITELQYQNSDIDEVDLLIYDEIADDWKLLRSFCKADCKFCYNITIDTTNCNPYSVFNVTEDGNTAWVFQEGDNIVMLGNQDNPGRQNAIYLCAGSQGTQGTQGSNIYGSLDTDLRPPFFAQYKGIGSQGANETLRDRFNLEKRKFTWFSGGYVGAQGFANQIEGNLKIISTNPEFNDKTVEEAVIEGYQGAQGYTDGQIIGVQSQIRTTAEGLQSEVNGVQARGQQGIQGVQSQITQQAGQITLQVMNNVGTELKTRTGIDINDGTITLDANNTNVTGALNIQNANSGLVLYDGNSPVISITNQTVGGANVSSSVQIIKGTQKHETTTTFTVSDIITSMTKITAGYYTLSNMTMWATPNSWTDQTNAFPLSNVKLSLSLHKWSDDDTISVIYDNVDFPVSGGAKYINIGGTNFSSSFSGNVYFKASMTFTFNSSQVLNGIINGVFTADLISSVNSATKIGNNGINILTDITNNKYAQFTQNGYILSWNDQKVEMNSAPVSGENILRRTVVHSDGDTCTGDIGSIIKCRIVTAQADLSLKSDDGFIVVKGTWANSPELSLLDPADYKGRVVHIKNMSDKTIKFKNSSSKLIEGKDVAADATNLIEDNIGCSTTFISDGEYWYQMSYEGN